MLTNTKPNGVTAKDSERQKTTTQADRGADEQNDRKIGNQTTERHAERLTEKIQTDRSIITVIGSSTKISKQRVVRIDKQKSRQTETQGQKNKKNITEKELKWQLKKGKVLKGVKKEEREREREKAAKIQKERQVELQKDRQTQTKSDRRRDRKMSQLTDMLTDRKKER